MKLEKNVRASMMITKFNTNGPEQVLRSGGQYEEYAENYNAGRFARCWRKILSTGCNTSKDTMLEVRPFSKK